MTESTYIDHHLIHKIQSAERGAIIVVESEGEEKQALRYIKLTRSSDGITVRVEKSEDHDGEQYVLKLED